MRFIILLSIVLSTFTAGTARADMAWHDAYKSPLSDWGAYQYDRIVKQPMAERARKTSQSRPAARAPLSASDFRRTGTGRGMVTKYVAALPLATADADQLTVALTTTLAQLQSTGRKNNVATAIAVTIVLANTVLERHEYDDAKTEQLVVSINDALAGSREFKQLGAPGRQQMADELYLSSALIVLLHQAGAVKASQAFAEQVLKTVSGSAS